MEFGVKILCPDNTTRLFFPRVLTYSADYPEKYVLYLHWPMHVYSPSHDPG
jgi:hypothetical protein